MCLMGVQLALYIHGFCMHGFKQLKFKVIEKKNSRNFQKQNLNLHCTGHYLHGIYIALNMISNLEMI